MRKFLSEKNVVIVLFVMVLITFALAQEDSKKLERLQGGGAAVTATVISDFESRISDF
jgi:hypothetical protein